MTYLLLSFSMALLLAIPATAVAQKQVAHFRVVPYNVSSLTFLPGGNRLVSGDGMGMVQVWKIGQKKPVQILQGHRRFASIPAVFPSKDKNALVSVGSGASAFGGKRVVETTLLLYWDLKKGKLIKRQTVRGHAFLSPKMTYMLVPNSYKLRIGEPTKKEPGYDPTSGTVYETATRKRIMVVDDHQEMMTCPTFSPDERWLATVSFGDGWIYIWNLKEKRKRRILNGSGKVTYARFSPDSKSLYAMHLDSDGSTLRKWDIDSEKLIWSTNLPRRGAHPFTLSPDGKRLAVRFHRQFRFFSAGNGVPLVWKTIPGEVCAFSADGRRFAVGDRRGEITVWDLPR